MRLNTLAVELNRAVNGKISPWNRSDVVPLWLGHMQMVVAEIVHVTHILTAARPMHVLCPCPLIIPTSLTMSTVSLTQKKFASSHYFYRSYSSFNMQMIHCYANGIASTKPSPFPYDNSRAVTVPGITDSAIFCERQVQWIGFTVETTTDHCAYHDEYIHQL